MPDSTARLFVVECKDCHRVLVTTARITDPEIVVLERHLRACCPGEPLEVSPMLGDLVRRVHVVRLEKQ